jgi:hypothetical protein
LVAADEVGGLLQAKFLEGGGCEAGAVALVADEDDSPVVIDVAVQSVRAGGVKSPLQDVAIDDNGAG